VGLAPLAGRMLASAGWAFGVATLAALHRFRAPDGDQVSAVQ
jgi:hypothetical protein